MVTNDFELKFCVEIKVYLGMTKEVSNLIKENNELLETK